MQKRSRLRVASSLMALLAAFMLAGAPVGAMAGPAQAAPGVTTTKSVNSSSALTFRLASTEEVKAMAAGGKGQLITLGSQAISAGATIQVTCTLHIGIPFGGGNYNSPVIVAGDVTCDDYVDVAVFTLELYRGTDRVANNTVTGFHVYGIYATTGVPTCTEGVYFGIVGVTVTRYGFNPPSATGNLVGYPGFVSCLPAPPTSPPPPAPLAVTNPGNQQSLDTATVAVQMRATGGTTPYTWSATGLPTGTSINSSSGLISGTTRIGGGYLVTVTVTDSGGRTASTQFTWAVKRDGCARC